MIETMDSGKTGKWKRYVLGLDEAHKSCVKFTEATMIKEEPDFYYRYETWATAEMPVDNSIEGDRALTSLTRAPKPNGASFRMLQIFPDAADPEEQRRKIEKLHRDTGQKHMPTAEDYNRHPSMHCTDTLDFQICVQGEIYLLTDTGEVLMRPGDSCVIRGVNHGWSNRGTEPALLAVTMIDAIPNR
jgi:mannose-6-phosphate isomerase-like protein (cupin superfamily)